MKMKKLPVVACALMLTGLLAAQAASLSESQITDVLNNLGKGDSAGLHMVDAWAMTCSGYRLELYSPEAYIRHQGRLARREMRPFGLKDVNDDMRRNVWRLKVYANKPTKVTNTYCADSPSHAVLRNKTKSLVIHPLSKEPFDDSVQNLGGAKLDYHGLDLKFDGVQVAELTGTKRDKGFFITVVGEKNNT